MLETRLKLDLHQCAAVYAQAAKVSMTTVGKRVANDGHFFVRLKNGAGFTVRTYDRAMLWFSRNWPPDAAWPYGIQRPQTKGKRLR